MVQCRRWNWGVWLVLLSLVWGLGACTGSQVKDDPVQKKAQWHYDMGAGYFEAGKIPLAIRELSLSLEQDPNSLKTHYLLGFIYMGRRTYPKAVLHFKEALRLEPGYHFARNNLGTVYLAMGRWEEAEQLFLQLLDEPLYTTPELAHNNVGWAYYNMRRHAEALEHFRMAAFLQPQMCLAHNNMGLTYEATANRVEAVASFRKAVEICPTNYAEPHFNLGRLLQEQGRGVAESHFRRCLELQPGNPLEERCRAYLMEP